MRKTLLLLVLTCGTSLLVAQSIIKGIVLEKDSNEPIQLANVKVSGQKLGTTTDYQGAFSLELSTFPAQLEITHIGFIGTLAFIEAPTDTVMFIYLEQNTLNLETVEVIAQKDKQRIIEDDISIEDFELLDSQFVLLRYLGTFKRYELSVTDMQGKTLFSKSVRKVRYVEGLRQSCQGTVYLITRDSAIQLGIQDHKIQLLYQNPIQDFEEYVGSCLCDFRSKLYYVEKYKEGLIKEILEHNRENKTRSVCRKLTEANRIRAYDEDRGQMARGTTVQTADFGSMPGVGDYYRNNHLRKVQQFADFYQKQVYGNNYEVHLNAVQDELVLFNYPQSVIEIYDEDSKLLRAQPTTFHLIKGWTGQVWYDEVHGDFYTLYRTFQGKTLCKIDLSSGDIFEIAQINAPFLSKLAIRAGIVYFTESGAVQSDAEKKLYKINI